MGTCNSTGHPSAFTMDELADLPLGERKDLAHGCGPSIDGTQGGSCYARLVQRGFACPNNGEFNWSGMGNSCNMCSEVGGGYGCDNCSGGKATGGHRGTVKRLAYLGDRKECCKQQKRLIDGKMCDPKYLKNYQDDTCDLDMKEYCVGETLTREECQNGFTLHWIKIGQFLMYRLENIVLKNQILTIRHASAGVIKLK